MSPEALCAELASVADLTVRADEPLARHNLLRVGGTVELWLVAETEASACEALKICREAAVRVRTLSGQHWLVRDEGLEGACLVLGAFARQISPIDGGLRVGGQVPLAQLAMRAARQGLGGLEGLGGRPGTVAEAMAAGLFGDRVGSVRALRGSRAANLQPEKWTGNQPLLHVDLVLDLELSAVVVAATQKCADSPGERPGRMMSDAQGHAAVALIGDAGLSGVRLRSVRIGQHEPNCLVNLGGASSRDVALVLAMIRDRVKQQTGVELKIYPPNLGRPQATRDTRARSGR